MKLNKLKKVLLYLFCLNLLSSCFVHVGKLTKRYAKIETIDSVKDTYLDVYGLSQPIQVEIKPITVANTVFNLSPQGQAALIKVYGAKTNKIDTIVSAIKEPLGKENKAKENSYINLSEISKIVILTVRKKMTLRDADRIARIDVGLKMKNSDIAQFIGCDRFSTIYGTADLGSLKYQDQRNAQLNASLGNSITLGSSNQNQIGTNNTTGSDIINSNLNGTTNNAYDGNGLNTSSNSSSTNNSSETSAANNSSTGTTSGSTKQTNFNTGVSGQLSASKSFSEEVSLRQRYINLSAYMAGNDLHFYEEGVSGIDVSGNISATIKVRFSDNIMRNIWMYNFDNLFKMGIPIAIDKVVANVLVVKAPILDSDVEIQLSHEAVVRYVTKGDKTISEADDHITSYHINEGPNPANNVLLFRKDELNIKLWGLFEKKGTNEIPLQISGDTTNPGAHSGPLYFSSYDDATSFLDWLNQNASKFVSGKCTIGKDNNAYRLYIDGGCLEKDAIKKLKANFVIYQRT